MAWWNDEYLFRRKVIIDPYVGDIPSGQDIKILLPITQFIGLNKTRVDYEDIEVLYQPGENLATPPATPVYQLLSREVDPFSVTFPLVEIIEEDYISDGEYWIYYGNSDLDNAPSRPTFNSNIWPIQVLYTDNRITYTRPNEHWINGESNVRNAKATFNFAGKNIRLISLAGPNRGKANIYIDDVLMETVDMWASEEQAIIAYSNEDLADTEHTIQIIVAYEKEPKSTEYLVSILYFEYAESYISIDGGEQFYAGEWVTYSGGQT